MKVLIVLYDGFTEFEYTIPLMALHHQKMEYEVVGLDKPAVRDGHIITGKGERVFHFTALLLEALVGKEKADEYRRWAGITREM